jgi:hypothetical protein
MCRDWTKRKPVSRRLSLSELVPPPHTRCGPTVRRWAVGVTTSPRRQPTLELCLDSIGRAGWDKPRLFLDGSARVPARYAHLVATWREERVGAWPAWYLALLELILKQPEADAYMLLQDDVVPYDRGSLRDYLERVLWPGERPGLISLFHTGHETTPGWRRAETNWDWGAQAHVLSPGAARALVSDNELSRSVLAASAENHIPIPELIYDWVMRKGIDTWYSIPSLTQHIGNTSTIWMDAAISGGRRASWFSGSVETEFEAGESLADFPEEVFPCHAEFRDHYDECVRRGREWMRELRVVFCGACHNARPFLPRTAARVERLGAMFRDYCVVICDDESTDSTLEFLHDWQKNNPRVNLPSPSLTTTGKIGRRGTSPTNSVAQCRNVYRSHILENFADFDYVIVFEADLLGGWSFDGIAHTFSGENWDFVGSYGLRHRRERQRDQPPFEHFDALAFRPRSNSRVSVPDCDGELNLLRGQPLLPVDSCFGGLAVYRLECLRSTEYGEDECEHVAFHDRLRRAGFGQIFLNPSQIAVHTSL